MNFFDINLPKWPACCVTGNSVTEEQAMEILIRTQNFYFPTNDHDFKKELAKTLGVNIESEQSWGVMKPEEMKRLQEEYQCLDLYYLSNEQICSAYTGGPNGWLNWNGTVHQMSKNIGKWPSVAEIFEEWKRIAQAFPFLNLRCQLFDSEYYTENPKPLIEFIVKDGKVEMKTPTDALPVADSNIDYSKLLRDGKERGCTIEKFKKALDVTKDSLNRKTI